MRRVLALPVAATLLGAAALAAAPAAAARGPQVSIFPSSVSFGSQPVGSVQQRSVSVQNYGDAPLHVHSVFVNDFSGSYSLVFNSCTGATVRPGGLCQFYIQFHPHTTGQHSAYAQVQDDAPGGAQNVPIWGNATAR
jgi:Abnormal spindle-like microcephaly-assoc'd, ASPM-SPD-2-Hydin